MPRTVLITVMVKIFLINILWKIVNEEPNTAGVWLKINHNKKSLSMRKGMRRRSDGSGGGGATYIFALHWCLVKDHNNQWGDWHTAVTTAVVVRQLPSKSADPSPRVSSLTHQEPHLHWKDSRSWFKKTRKEYLYSIFYRKKQEYQKKQKIFQVPESLFTHSPRAPHLHSQKTRTEDREKQEYIKNI